MTPATCAAVGGRGRSLCVLLLLDVIHLASGVGGGRGGEEAGEEERKKRRRSKGGGREDQKRR